MIVAYMSNQPNKSAGGVNLTHIREPEKFNGAEQGSMYDKVFKENMEQTLPDIIKDILHLKIVSSEEIPDDLQHTKERKPDLLKRAKDAEGNIFIIHVEYQKDDDELMVGRMAEYYIMLHRKYKLPIVQFVIYIGKGKPIMPTIIKTKHLRFWFNLVALSEVNYKVFLRSEKLEQRMLAILGNLGAEGAEQVLEHILLDIESQNAGELTEGKYLRQLRVLLELRNLDKQTLIDMALVGKIFVEENDILYIRGENKGLEKGKHQEALEIARNLKNKDVTLDIIAEATGLSVQQIEAL